MEIIPFTPDRYDALLALWDHCGLPYEKHGRDSREQLERQTYDDHVVFLVMTDNGHLIGSVIGTYDGRKGWINRLAIDPEYRGRRLAARLIAAAETGLAEMGAAILSALIEDQNFPSMAAFTQAGYTGWEHIVYFRKELKARR